MNIAVLVVAAAADCPEPTGVQDVVEAMVEVEAALRDGGTLPALGDALHHAAHCSAEGVPRPIRARVLRAIGATRQGEERTAWWSAARSLHSTWEYGQEDVPEPVREAWQRGEAASWDHLPLAVRLTQRDPPRPRTPAPTSNQYGVLPLPRVWGLVGVSNRGFEPAVGGSIGLGSTFVFFGEWTGGPETFGFFGVGTHSFIGDSYTHVYQGGMHCLVLHRHYVRPGLLVGALRENGSYGFRVRPEVSLGAVGNLVAAAPISWLDGQGWSVGLQVGAALGFP